jgi:small subunit ribosomal protein S18
MADEKDVKMETVLSEEQPATPVNADDKSEKKYSPKHIAKKKVCAFCADKVNDIDYKDAAKLRKFMTEKGKILPACQTGTCAFHQRKLARAIKQARNFGILPYQAD